MGVNTLSKLPESSQYWHLYFLRFLVILWFLIWPCVFAFSFWLLREINRGKRTDITFAQFLLVKKYSYVFHNCVLVFVLMSWVGNMVFVLWTFCDTYVLSLNAVHSWIWHIPSNEASKTNRHNTFFAVLMVGCLLHFLSGSFYVYFNLYSTHSYFGERWRDWVRWNMRGNRRWIRFRKRHPRLYELLYPYVFDVDYADKYKNVRIYTIDPD